MLSAGQNLGHYTVRSAIGAGGMGEIYRARDGRLRRDVAIKILPESLTRDKRAIDRFMLEAHAASALNHPNILTIFDIGRHEDIHFIATEFVDGQTLRSRMDHSPLTIGETLDIAIQVSDALASAHAAGIVHRDIKPENVMLRKDGYVKILDFGLAKLTELLPEGHESDALTLVQTKTIPGMILGTANYMSPEQARGLEVDARSDIFSLGIVLYEMVTGRLPFSGATVSDVIASILSAEPKPISAYVQDVPAELSWCAARALAKDRDERYQSIRELLADLRRLRQRLEIEAELGRVRSSKAAISTGAFAVEPATLVLPATALQQDSPARARKTRKAIDSLAVLPLANAANDENTEYLADGITESIINSLSRLPKLRVVPRSTVFRYKNHESDVQEIGNNLGVRAVFTGRVEQLGEWLIVKAELIDVANESQLWGEQYRRKMTNIFPLLDDIAEDISEKLRLRLSGDQKKRLAKRYTKNTEAYQFYLKGRYFVTTKRTEEWIKKGIDYFQKAVDLDPNYALAYSGMAEAYGFLASSTGGWRPNDGYPKAKAAALKALELDDDLGEAHCSLGFSRLLYDWDWAAAEREYKKAIRLSPNYPAAHDGYGFFLKAMGRHEEAIEKCKKVQLLDPLSPFAHITLAYAYYFARDYARAVDEANKALEMDRHSVFAYRILGLSYLQQGKLDRAIAALNQAITFSSGGVAFEAYLAIAYAAAGKRKEAIELLASLHETAKERYVSAYNFAVIYLALGDMDNAFLWFEKGFDERSGFLPFLKVEPLVDPARSDPRFRALLQRVGLPD